MMAIKGRLAERFAHFVVDLLVLAEGTARAVVGTLLLNSYSYLAIAVLLILWQLNVRGAVILPMDVAELTQIFKSPVQAFHDPQIRGFMSDALLFNALGHLFAPTDDCGLKTYLALLVTLPPIVLIGLTVVTRDLSVRQFADAIAWMAAFPIMAHLFLWMGKPDALVVAGFAGAILAGRGAIAAASLAVAILCHPFVGAIGSAYLVLRLNEQQLRGRVYALAATAGVCLIAFAIASALLYRGNDGRVSFLVTQFVHIVLPQGAVFPVTVAGIFGGGWMLLLYLLPVEPNNRLRVLDTLYVAATCIVAGLLVVDSTRIGMLLSVPLAFSLLKDVYRTIHASEASKEKILWIRTLSVGAAVITAAIPQVWGPHFLSAQYGDILGDVGVCVLHKEGTYFRADRVYLFLARPTR
jgi:hypothetical protein